MPRVAHDLFVGHAVAVGGRHRCYLPCYFALPHPSWRAGAWERANPWFTSEVLLALRVEVAAALKYETAFFTENSSKSFFQGHGGLIGKPAEAAMCCGFEQCEFKGFSLWIRLRQRKRLRQPNGPT